MDKEETPIKSVQSNLLDCRSVYRCFFETDTRVKTRFNEQLLFDDIDDARATSLSSKSRDSLDSIDANCNADTAALAARVEEYRAVRKELTLRRTMLEQRLQKLKSAI